MTDAEIEREIDREDRLAQLYDLAGRYVKAAIARGEAFTEDLSNQAMEEALSDLDFT
jgi:hypothetical protein